MDEDSESCDPPDRVIKPGTDSAFGNRLRGQGFDQWLKDLFSDTVRYKSFVKKSRDRPKTGRTKRTASRQRLRGVFPGAADRQTAKKSLPSPPITTSTILHTEDVSVGIPDVDMCKNTGQYTYINFIETEDPGYVAEPGNGLFREIKKYRTRNPNWFMETVQL